MIPIIYNMSEKEVLSFEPKKGFGIIYKYDFPTLVSKYIKPSYVGQTTQGLSRRHAQHKSHTKTRNIFNNTLSTHTYVLHIIELCPESDLNDKEIFWIKEFDTIYPKGLNYNSGGKRYKMNEATRQKLSESLKKSKLSSKEQRMKTSKRVTEQWQDPIMREKMMKSMREKHKPRSEEYMAKIRTPVMQLSLDGRFIALYPSITQASKDTGIEREQIRDTVSGKQNTCKGFRFIGMCLGR